MSVAKCQSHNGKLFNRIFRSLFAKFLLVLIPVFIALAIPGLTFLVNLEMRDHEEELAARMGNRAARTAVLLTHFDVISNPHLARDILASLAVERAFLCAELRAKSGDRVLMAAPTNIGCLGQNGEHKLVLDIGEERTTTLVIQFTDAEIIEAKKLQQSLTYFVVIAALLFATIASGFGFRLIVTQPLVNLLSAIRRNAESGGRHEVNVSSNDELGTVAVAYNNMLERDHERERILKHTNEELRTSREDLIKLSAELEERVKLRTLELKDREAALFDSKQRFSDFANSSSDWYWEMDENLRFSYFSDKFSEITGVSPSMLLGKTREETGVPDVDPDQWKRHLDALHHRRQFRNFIHPRVKPDGKTVWLSINGIPYFGRDGEFKGYRGTGNEITDLVEAQRHAEQAQIEAEKANRAKSDFLANMSHELRTPLNAIIGFSETMLQGIFGPLGSEKYHEYATAIHQSGRHLLDLVNDVLDMAKIESGSYDLSLQPIDLGTLVDDTFKLVQGHADRNRVKLEKKLTGDVSMITADKRAMRQILLNLISNAVKFTPEGGNVIVSAASDEDDLILYVDDTGIGIAANDIPILTDPFTQVSSAQAYISAEGTGLGLSIVASLVKLHHGKLEISSEVGRGTRVKVFLPGVLREAKRHSYG